MWKNYSNIQKIILVFVFIVCSLAIITSTIKRDISFIAVATVFLGIPWSLLFSYITSLLTDAGWHSITMVCFGTLGAYLNWRLLLQSSFAKKTTSQIQQLPAQIVPENEKNVMHHLYRSLAIQYSIFIIFLLGGIADILHADVSEVVMPIFIGLGTAWFIAVIRSMLIYTGCVWKYWPILSSKAKVYFVVYYAQLVLFVYMVVTFSRT